MAGLCGFVPLSDLKKNKNLHDFSATSALRLARACSRPHGAPGGDDRARAGSDPARSAGFSSLHLDFQTKMIQKM